jgi:hypothetical protein
MLTVNRTREEKQVQLLPASPSPTVAAPLLKAHHAVARSQRRWPKKRWKGGGVKLELISSVLIKSAVVSSANRSSGRAGFYCSNSIYGRRVCACRL